MNAFAPTVHYIMQAGLWAQQWYIYQGLRFNRRKREREREGGHFGVISCEKWEGEE